MKIRYFSIVFGLLLAGAVMVLPGCGGEPEEVDLVISDLEYSIVQEGRRYYAVNVTGTIRNEGNVDVSDVVISGGCPECQPTTRAREWLFSEEFKTDEQRDVIRFMGRGERRDFAFGGLAYFRTGGGDPPTEVPVDLLEVYVESYQR